MKRHNNKYKEIATIFFLTKSSVYLKISDCTVFNTQKKQFSFLTKNIFWGPILLLTEVFPSACISFIAIYLRFTFFPKGDSSLWAGLKILP